MSTLTGQTLGKYQLINRLGRGGMADVYKGYQPGLDRYVAVKVLHPHLSDDPDFITRFKREAKSVAELRHPHIVQVFDFDIQGENYYMVMEYVEGGRTLKQLLLELAAKAERLPINRTLDIVARLADALAYAHGLGMIHRDIKPANVLIPSLDRPVLSDFGIARLLGETGLTSSGTMVGTPAYMSPEQGKGERGDARSDIYALGIVLYEMLTGHPPYDADTPYAVILKHINDPLVPPRSLIVSLPEAVERIVLRCLAKNPDDRFQSMAGLRDALRTAIDETRGQTTLDASTPQTIRRTAEPAATKQARAGLPRWALVVAAVAVIGGAIAVIGGLGGRTPAAGPAPPSPPIEEAPPAEPSPAGSEVAALVKQGYGHLFGSETQDALDSFSQALSVAPDDPHLHYGYALLYVRSDDRQDPHASDEEATLAIDACGEDMSLCIEAYRLRSGVRFWNLEDAAGGIADMDSAIALSSDPVGTAYLRGERADLRRHAGDSAGALADYEEAYNLSGIPDFLEQAAYAAVATEDYQAGLGYYQRLIDEQAGNPHYLAMRGYVEWQAGDSETALETAQRTIDLSDALEGHYLRGLLLLEAGQPQEALAELEQVGAVTDTDVLYQIGFPFLITDFGHEIYYDLARAYHALGDSETALNYIEQTLQRDDYWPQPYLERGMILFEQGDLAGARESYLQALDTADDDDEMRAHIEELLAGLTK